MYMVHVRNYIGQLRHLSKAVEPTSGAFIGACSWNDISVDSGPSAQLVGVFLAHGLSELSPFFSKNNRKPILQ